jgi:hypothetical protein
MVILYQCDSADKNQKWTHEKVKKIKCSIFWL